MKALQTLPALLLLLSSSRAVAVDVIDWSLASSVYDSQTGDLPSVHFQTVQSPFEDSHSATLRSSIAHAAYDFSWTADEASFASQFDHHIESLRGTTTSSGYIRFTPGVDSVLSIDASWSYDFHPAELSSADLSLLFGDVESDTVLFVRQLSGGTFGLGAPSGTLAVSRHFDLLALRTYLVDYSVVQRFWDPPAAGHAGEATGHVRFQVTPLPEPAALGLLLAGAILLHRRPVLPRRQRETPARRTNHARGGTWSFVYFSTCFVPETRLPRRTFHWPM